MTQPSVAASVAESGAPLLYSRGFVRSLMIEPGRTGAYLALFSEIGFILLVAPLAGVGIGYWADTQLRIIPVLTLVGLFAGLALGARMVWTLINRFLARIED